MERIRMLHTPLSLAGLLLAVLLAATSTPAVTSAQASASSPRCEELAARFLLQPDSFHVAPAEATRISVGPTAWPISVTAEEIIAHLLIDTNGRVVRDSTWFEPTQHSRRFTRTLQDAVVEYRYRPATLEGCPLSSWSTVRLLRPRRG